MEILMYKTLIEKSDAAYQKAVGFVKSGDVLLAMFYYNASKGYQIKAERLFDKDMENAKGEI